MPAKAVVEIKVNISSLISLLPTSLQAFLFIVKNKVKSMKNGKRIPEYAAWHTMRHRCYITTHHAYKDYGGRGIKVSDRWLNSFDNFLEDMGFRPSDKHTLDRIKNDKDYSPENCRWATMKQQCNNRRNNRWIEHNGQRKTASQWAEFLNADIGNLFSNKKKTFKQIYDHHINGGGQPSVRIEFNNQSKKISEWAKELKICDRYLRQLILKKQFSEVYNKYKVTL